MKTITAWELKKIMDKDDVVLIDVREPAEYRSERIEGGRLIPLGEISAEQLPSSKKIAVYCRSGKRSADACEKLLIHNPSLDVASLEGGILSWIQAGFKVKNQDQ